MNGLGQSDRPIVPKKPPNKAGEPAAEGMEGRGLTKGNPSQQNARRAQHRDWRAQCAGAGTGSSERDKAVRFTTLRHHVYDVERLRAAYHALKSDAAPGIDGETWQHYGEDLEENLADLSGRLKRGERIERSRCAGVHPQGRRAAATAGRPMLEDKLVQSATAEVLNAIYETDFLGFSYGFRPGRNPHDALDALYAGLMTGR